MKEQKVARVPEVLVSTKLQKPGEKLDEESGGQCTCKMFRILEFWDMLQNTLPTNRQRTTLYIYMVMKENKYHTGVFV